MLEDRDYMRQPEYDDSGWRPASRMRWSWTVGLLAVYLLAFVVEQVVRNYFPGNHFFYGHLVAASGELVLQPGYLPLSVEGLMHGYGWQLVTYQFMHAGWLHLLLNGWVIFMFGRELEHNLGGRKYLTLILSSGIIGGIFQMLAALLWPQYFGTHLEAGQIVSGETVGASACAFGLVAAFAAMFPQRELTLLLFFVIPLHLRARTLLIVSGVIALIGFGWHFDKVAHAAHLGGMAMGWIFVRNILPGGWRRLGGRRLAAKSDISPRLPGEAPGEVSASDFMANEVDPILDKISAHGIQSLTARERKILEAARKHVRRP